MDVRIEKIIALQKEYQEFSEHSRIIDTYNYLIALVSQQGETIAFLDPAIESATILSEIYLEEDMIIVTLLQDCIMANFISIDDVRLKFGDQIAELGGYLYDVLSIPLKTSTDELQMETMRRMLISFANDMRVVFIKFANMLRDMQSFEDIYTEDAQKIAQHIMYIAVPLADRLGIWQFKSRMEDLAFHSLYESEYNDLHEIVSIFLQSNPHYIKKMEHALQELFEKYEFAVGSIKGRVKTLYSIYRKMELQQKTLEEIHDIFAIRIIVDTIGECYEALGIVHSQWRPFAHATKDYIARPKENGYQSLHTTVLGIDGRLTEIQIRTKEMNEFAEYGLAAHFVYGEHKESRALISKYNREWIQSLQRIQKEIDGGHSSILLNDLFQDRIFVFTPVGDVVELPQKSCAIDFAYAVHSKLGDRCVGAKINGRIQSLYTILNNGDTVEILSTKNAPGPRYEWLRHAVTTKAKAKIRNHIKQQDRDIHLDQGKKMLEQEFKKINKKFDKELQQKILTLLPYVALDDFYVALGEGAINTSLVINKLFSEKEIFTRKKESISDKNTSDTFSKKQRIIIENDDSISYDFAQCCSPQFGDEIIAYVGIQGGIKIHTTECKQINIMDFHRILEAYWYGGVKHSTYAITLFIETLKKNGILETIMLSFMNSGYKIDNIRTESGDGKIYLEVDTRLKGYNELTKIFDFLEKINGILDVRINDKKIS